MKELPISIQKETNGGFALPFIITIAAVVAGLDVYKRQLLNIIMCR